MIQSAGPGDGVLRLSMVLCKLLMEMPWSLDGQPLPLTEKAEAAPKRKLHRTDEKSNQVHSRHMYVLYFSSLSLYLAPIISGGVSMTICSFS